MLVLGFFGLDDFHYFDSLDFISLELLFSRLFILGFVKYLFGGSIVRALDFVKCFQVFFL